MDPANSVGMIERLVAESLLGAHANMLDRFAMALGGARSGRGPDARIGCACRGRGSCENLRLGVGGWLTLRAFTKSVYRHVRDRVRQQVADTYELTKRPLFMNPHVSAVRDVP